MNLIHKLHYQDNPNSLASRLRRARAKHVIALIEAVVAEKGEVKILDLGGEPDYWRLYDRAFLEASKVKITLVNPQAFSVDDPLFESVEGDACDLKHYPDLAFDLVHSNSVVEHVGDWKRMEAFASEARRLARRYYIQTPYFWFPIEPHFSAPFFHWRSEQSRARSLMKRAHGFAPKADNVGQAMRDVQDARLLDKAQFRFLFPDARHMDERFGGLTKSLLAVRA